MSILELKNVTKRFGGLTALDNVSFSLGEGEFLGIAGPNGSGKSTLFNVISGIPFQATSGEICFRGQTISRESPHNIARMGLARTFQKDAEFPDLSARETVAVAASYGRNLKQNEALNSAEEHLAEVEFNVDRADMLTTELSVYERKQLMIASALVMKPKILMLDEPASGLTRPEIAVLNALLVKINQSGVTILLIEHVLSLLLSVVNQLLVLNHGAILAEGKPQEAIQNTAVVEAFLGYRTTKLC